VHPGKEVPVLRRARGPIVLPRETAAFGQVRTFDRYFHFTRKAVALRRSTLAEGTRRRCQLICAIPRNVDNLVRARIVTCDAAQIAPIDSQYVQFGGLVAELFSRTGRQRRTNSIIDMARRRTTR
jgi:hypothetical protein